MSTGTSTPSRPATWFPRSTPSSGTGCGRSDSGPCTARRAMRADRLCRRQTPGDRGRRHANHRTAAFGRRRLRCSGTSPPATHASRAGGADCDHGRSRRARCLCSAGIGTGADRRDRRRPSARAPHAGWQPDAQLIPVVLGGASEVLDLGRSRRLFTKAQRLALAERDDGCAWPGCPHPPSYTEAHHIRWWEAHAGPTDLRNGVLLCSSHHHRVHHDDWDIAVRDIGAVLRPALRHLDATPMVATAGGRVRGSARRRA